MLYSDYLELDAFPSSLRYTFYLTHTLRVRVLPFVYVNRFMLRGRARCVAPLASADVASAASGRALTVGVNTDLGGIDV